MKAKLSFDKVNCGVVTIYLPHIFLLMLIIGNLKYLRDNDTINMKKLLIDNQGFTLAGVILLEYHPLH